MRLRLAELSSVSLLAQTQQPLPSPGRLILWCWGKEGVESAVLLIIITTYPYYCYYCYYCCCCYCYCYYYYFYCLEQLWRAELRFSSHYKQNISQSGAHSEHRFPALFSLKEGCRKPVLGVCHQVMCEAQTITTCH